MNKNATSKALSSGRPAATGSTNAESVSGSFAMPRLSGNSESFFKDTKLSLAHSGSGSLWNDAHGVGVASGGVAAFPVGAKENLCHAYR